MLEWDWKKKAAVTRRAVKAISKVAEAMEIASATEASDCEKKLATYLYESIIDAANDFDTYNESWLKIAEKIEEEEE